MKALLRSRNIIIVLHVLIWGMVLLLPYLVSTEANDYRVGPLPGTFFTLSGIIHLIIFYVNAFFLCPRWLNRRYWWLYIVAAAALLGGSFWLKYHMMAWWYPELLQDRPAYRAVFSPSVGVFVISLVYRKILDRIRVEKEQKEKQAQQLSSELKFLRSQISPHFLFNVLTNLVSLARKKSDQLEPSLIMLSELMRYMIYDAGGARVAVTKEVAYLESYIALQRLRFGTDVDIQAGIHLEENAGAQLIEPMLLIPFVENAFKHGTGVVSPVITVRLYVKQEELVFEVNNAYDRILDSSKDESSGIGLANVRSRLDLLYRHKHQLKIMDNGHEFNISLTLTLI
ncbi:sensor histidine kinase [Chitinophaga solisilvae]|uniref:sensor histidine kinase n=1 Tax=Chitinophaga solisilvae TaxID=1233460 RepID=UPI00136948ED|nr:histidine kinase [Chitinophaga solisilvae]